MTITSRLPLALYLTCISILSFAQQNSIDKAPNKYIYDAACFLSDGFPSSDAPQINADLLKKAVKDFQIDYFKSAEDFNNKLNKNTHKILLLPYGSSFPADAWSSIYRYLSEGGGLIILGGSPFYQPVLSAKTNNPAENKWILGSRSPAFAHQLLIGPSDKIELNGSDPFYRVSKIISLNENEVNPKNLFIPNAVYEPTVRFAAVKEFPDEDGSYGPTEAVLRPLLHIVNEEGLPIACPLYEIDRLRGNFKGGRWVIASSDAELDESFIKFCVKRALESSVEFKAVPVYAVCFQNEDPQINISLSIPVGSFKSSSDIDIKVKNENGKVVFNKRFVLKGTPVYQSALIKIKTGQKLKPGFYKVEVKALTAKFHPNKISTGFWVRKNKLFKTSIKLSVSKDWIKRDGKIYPVIGTTYMASDVHRKFLLEPNPELWDRDFKRMSDNGINFIRTGIWTGWKKIMQDTGSFEKNILRSLDAFLLTAEKYSIPVCFTFFAFTPPLNGGTNPYLDSKALEYQKKFISILVERYKNSGWIHWDLINEPSYSPPERIWNTLPVNDTCEQQAWKNWLIKKYGNNPSHVKDIWKSAEDNIFSMPEEIEFSYSMVRDNRRFRKTIDFILFSQDVITGWAKELKETINNIDPDAIVTLGQDEGGTGTRPSQQFHYPAVDYTSIHTWWLNDDLLWDALMTKVPGVPNLISETGLMRLEDLDGNPWRTPNSAYQLLRRKFALAFAGKGAGAVEWAWNINPYQPVDNEAVIGIVRPDGTYKEEIKVIKEFSNFFNSTKKYLADYERSEVLIIIPHAKIFSGRREASAAVKKVTRILSERFGVIPTLISQYKLSDETIAGAKLIIVPSIEMLDEIDAEVLYKASLSGSSILFTGAIEKRGIILDKLYLDHQNMPVNYKEFMHRDYLREDIYLTFNNSKSEYLQKSSGEFRKNRNIYHEPVPVEHASEETALLRLLNVLLDESSVNHYYSDEPVLTSIVKCGDSKLCILVNESNKNIQREFDFYGHHLDVNIEPGGVKLFFVNNNVSITN